MPRTDRVGAPSGNDKKTDKADSHEPRKPAAKRFFFDDFSGLSLDRRKWSQTIAVTVVRDAFEDDESAALARLDPESRNSSARPEMCSVAIPLAGAAGAELSFTVRHRGVEAGERLDVEYLASDDQWRMLERVAASGPDSIRFSRRMRVLPKDALHAGFRFRFRPRVDDADDAWYVGEVMVLGHEPSYTLDIRVRPARSVRVEVLIADSGRRLDGSTPFTRTLQADTQVLLLPPPAVDGWVFSHWTVDDLIQADRRRRMAVDVRKNRVAVAHYRPWVSGRVEASVVVHSIPEPGIPIAMGFDPADLFTEIGSDGDVCCLTGETLALHAAERTNRFVFVGWVVNGQMLPDSDSLLVHRVGGDDVLLAEYVLLGDMNGDGQFDKFDVDAFIMALVDPEGYIEAYPDLDRLRRGDMNADGTLDILDVEYFVDLMVDE